MATLHIDKIIAEKVNQDDLIRLLETVIDEEMQRPEAEMNCDLIDQCVDALLEMRQDRDHLAVMVPLMQDKAFLHLIQRKAGNTARLNGAARGALIAAAILASTISVNAMVDAAFDYNILEHIGKAISASVLGPEIIGGEDDVDEPTHCARHHGKEPSPRRCRSVPPQTEKPLPVNRSKPPRRLPSRNPPRPLLPPRNGSRRAPPRKNRLPRN